MRDTRHFVKTLHFFFPSLSVCRSFSVHLSIACFLGIPNKPESLKRKARLRQRDCDRKATETPPRNHSLHLCWAEKHLRHQQHPEPWTGVDLEKIQFDSIIVQVFLLKWQVTSYSSLHLQLDFNDATSRSYVCLWIPCCQKWVHALFWSAKWNQTRSRSLTLYCTVHSLPFWNIPWEQEHFSCSQQYEEEEPPATRLTGALHSKHTIKRRWWNLTVMK